MGMENIRYRIGKAYVEGTFESEGTDFVRKAYEEISRVSAELFKAIPYEVEFTEEDLYTSASEMRKAVQDTGTIKIYSGWSGHPYLTQEQNNVGRAVHDVFAHLVCGCPFTFQGEYNAYLEQRKYYPEWTWKVLFAEIPGQTSAYYYMNDFTYNQRAFEAPSEWLEWCEELRKDYSCTSILDSLLPKYV